MTRAHLAKVIAATAQLFGRDFTKDAADLFVRDFDGYDPKAVVAAIARCRKEIPRFPSIAEILERIDDGRPGPDEAWAMVPKDEWSSVVWTDEMREAFNTSRSLLDQDLIAARMAFKETYQRLVAKARADHRPARWSPSLGLNKSTHGPTLLQAAEKGRITPEHAESLIGESSDTAARLKLMGGQTQNELSAIDPQVLLAAIREQVEKAGDKP